MSANYKSSPPPSSSPHPTPRHTSPPPPPPHPPSLPSQASELPPNTPKPSAPAPEPADKHSSAVAADAPSDQQQPIKPAPAPPQTAPPYPDHHWHAHPHPYAFHPVYTYPPPPHPDYHHYRLMPHRVEADRHSAHHSDDGYQRMHSQPTPPPIATLHHSPAMSTSSLASSSISPSPPVSFPTHSRSYSYYYDPREHHPDMHVSAYQLPQSGNGTPYYQQPPAGTAPAPGGYTYAPPGPPSARYPPADASAYAHGGTGLMRNVRTSYGAHAQPSYPGQPNYIIYTNDAATKLSDRVRRKCYNCHTTDTSTWRRSSLTPGKVLCNKCGLFERTHSRPRPDQFPHKRGPLVTTTFKSSARSPPPASRLPSMTATHHHTQQVHHGHHQHGQVQAFPPHHANHASIAPLMQRDGHHQAQQTQQQYYAQDQQGQQQAQGEDQQNQGNASQMPEIRSLLNTPAGGSPASGGEGVEEQQHPMEAAEVGGSPRERREVYHAQA